MDRTNYVAPFLTLIFDAIDPPLVMTKYEMGHRESVICDLGRMAARVWLRRRLAELVVGAKSVCVIPPPIDSY